MTDTYKGPESFGCPRTANPACDSIPEAMPFPSLKSQASSRAQLSASLSLYGLLCGRQRHGVDKNSPDSIWDCWLLLATVSIWGLSLGEAWFHRGPTSVHTKLRSQDGGPASNPRLATRRFNAEATFGRILHPTIPLQCLAFLKA